MKKNDTEFHVSDFLPWKFCFSLCWFLRVFWFHAFIACLLLRLLYLLLLSLCEYLCFMRDRERKRGKGEWELPIWMIMRKWIFHVASITFFGRNDFMKMASDFCASLSALTIWFLLLFMQVVVLQANGRDSPSSSVHVFHVGKMRIKLRKGRSSIAREPYSAAMQVQLSPILLSSSQPSKHFPSFNLAPSNHPAVHPKTSRP